MRRRHQLRDSDMRNFTIKQLQAAFVELYSMDNMEAYQLCFSLLEEKMGEDAFDAWMDSKGF